MSNFPSLEKSNIVAIKKFIDSTFREFASTWGESFQDFLSPLLYFLIWFEKLLLATPYYVFLLVVGLLIWVLTKNWKIILGSLTAFIAIGLVGMWDDTMRTLAIVSVSTFICVTFGIPLGILMAKKDKAQSIILPMLDFMQTIPSFVYLIPVIMLFGLGKVPGLIAICFYAMPPVIRFTNIGIREINKDLIETAEALGLRAKHILALVELPLARATIFGGINQTIMMALAMVVIASMIGVRGLGSQVMNAVGNQFLGLGVISGLSIVALAIIIDRVVQAYNKRDDRWKK